MINAQDIIRLAKYFTPISHTPGRLRVKISLEILKESDNFSLQEIEALPQKIDGLLEIKLNKLFQTATISYDQNVIGFDLWEDLLHQRALERTLESLKALQRNA